MIHIFHGNNIKASRDAFLRERSRHEGKEVRSIEGKTATEDIFIQSVSSSSLFLDSVVVKIENLLSPLGKKKKQQEHFISLLLAHKDDACILLWEEKELSASVLSYFTHHAKIELFKLPVLLFQFLDNITPQNPKQNIMQYKKLIALGEPPELIHALIKKRMVQLLEVKSTGKVKDLAAWQATRLTKQAGFFTMSELNTRCARVLENDFAMKTGAGALNIQQQTELLLVAQ